MASVGQAISKGKQVFEASFHLGKRSRHCVKGSLRLIDFAGSTTIDRVKTASQHALMQEFCEECPDQKKVVMRNARYRDNASLPSAVEEMAGDNIYRGLRDGFRVRVRYL